MDKRAEDVTKESPAWRVMEEAPVDEKVSLFLTRARSKINDLVEDIHLLLSAKPVPRLASANVLALHLMEQIGMMAIETWKHRIGLTGKYDLLTDGKLHICKMNACIFLYGITCGIEATQSGQRMQEAAIVADNDIGVLRQRLADIAETTQRRVLAGVRRIADLHGKSSRGEIEADRKKLLYVDLDWDEVGVDVSEESVEEILVWAVISLRGLNNRCLETIAFMGYLGDAMRSKKRLRGVDNIAALMSELKEQNVEREKELVESSRIKIENLIQRLKL